MTSERLGDVFERGAIFTATMPDGTHRELRVIERCIGGPAYVDFEHESEQDVATLNSELRVAGTVYEPVPEPAGPLWTRDEGGTVRRWERVPHTNAQPWRTDGGKTLRSWDQLLKLRPFDQHPDLPEGAARTGETRTQ